MADSTHMRVRLTPRGGKDALIKREAGTLYARVAAPPVDGAANRSLVALLARTLGIAKSRVSIVSGDTNREKMVRLDGISAGALDSLLESALSDKIRLQDDASRKQE